MPDRIDVAPGAPGIPARWTSSAKTGVGTALSSRSRVWFTLSHGILNEVYYPRVDSACIRDMEFIVTGPAGFFFEEKRGWQPETRPVEPGVPAYVTVNESRDSSVRIEKRGVTDPVRSVLLQHLRFRPRDGCVGDYRVHALLAPHLVNAGAENSAWLGHQDGAEVLFASGRQHYLALVSSLPWRAMSAGYVGTSDGYQQLLHDGRIATEYQRADDGNVALVGEIGVDADHDEAVLALGFGQTETEAAKAALLSLRDGFDAAWGAYVKNWRDWQAGLQSLDHIGGPGAYRTSTAVLAAHRAEGRAGAVVASLSIPWGFSKGDDDLGGYHLVWPRDLVETAGGFLAAGDTKEAIAVLAFLREVQEPSGRWPQNLWLDGRPYWHGEQMDEVAFPILLAEMLWRHGALTRAALKSYLPMIRKAAGHILMDGPVTGEDRWEEDAGYSPFTLAVEVAALLAAADLLDEAGEGPAATHLRETADCWNEQIETWTFGGDQDLCRRLGIEGYYVRIAAPAATDVARPDGTIPIRNREADQSELPAAAIIATDALALVRFGLRAADDPRILATVTAIDEALKVPLPQGPLWRRYTGDGYGEHEDGCPFDGTGRGRPWPLLTGERAHYELAAGRSEAALALLDTMEHSTGASGLIPEQIWDEADIPEAELFRGKPAGSAMPLVWAHAEHIKLLRSLRDGALFDRPPQALARYVEGESPARVRIWRFNNKIIRLPVGRLLRIELAARARVHWSSDGWATVTDTETTASALGSWFADLDTAGMAPGTAIDFTLWWLEANRWEGTDFHVAVEAEEKVPARRFARSDA